MHEHRFQGLGDIRPVLSAAAPAPPSASGFVLCPAGGQGQAWPWQVYYLAYEQAQAVVRPSRLERLQIAGLN